MNESFGNVAADTNLPKAERAAGERLKWRASQILAPLTGSVDWSPYILTLGAVFFNKIQKNISKVSPKSNLKQAKWYVWFSCFT